MTKKEIGKIGEDYTAEYLLRKGCRILERNFTVRGGEIDIIAEIGGVIHFVEVKTRKPDPLTSGEEAINRRKRELIVRAAGEYLLRNGLEASGVFDAAVVELSEGKVTNFKYIQRAFTA